MTRAAWPTLLRLSLLLALGVSAALRVAHAAETIRARWEQRTVESPQVEAAQALEDSCQLLDPEVAEELRHLRSAFVAQRSRAETLDGLARRLQDRVAELEPDDQRAPTLQERLARELALADNLSHLGHLLAAITRAAR